MGYCLFVISEVFLCQERANKMAVLQGWAKVEGSRLVESMLHRS